MTGSKPFEFDGYQLRNATVEQDEQLAAAWTTADEYHKDVDPRFWLEKGPGVETYILEGADGEPLLFLRLDKSVRLRIQFPPNIHPHGSDDDKAQRARVRNALTRGMAFLDVALSVRQFREIIFDSVSPLLRAFAIGRLRFTRKPDTLSRMLPSFTIPKNPRRDTLHAEKD